MFPNASYKDTLMNDPSKGEGLKGLERPRIILLSPGAVPALWSHIPDQSPFEVERISDIKNESFPGKRHGCLGIVANCGENNGSGIDFRAISMILAKAGRVPVIALADNPSPLDRLRLSNMGVGKILPCDAGVTEAAEALKKLSTAARHGELAYIVHGNVEIAEGIRGDLEKIGCAALAFSNPGDMILAWFDEAPDLVLIDWDDADIDAGDFCSIIKRDLYLRDIPVVAVISDTCPEKRRTIFDAGADDYVTVPILRRELIARVAFRINQRRKRPPFRITTDGGIERRSRSDAGQSQNCATPSLLVNGRVKVLIADDQQPILSMLEHHFRREDWDVTVVTDGESAYKALGAGVFSFALLDTSMPFRTGYDIIKWMRGAGVNVNCKTIIMTAEDPDRAAAHAFSIGADDLIKKPINPDAMVSRMKRYLSGNSCHE